MPDQFLKTGGIIYPIDKTGGALLDATNTPNLSFIRNQYWEMTRKQVQTNVLFAEMVASFASDISGLGHAADASNYVTGEDIDGSVPTPPEKPEDKVDHSSDDSSN